MALENFNASYREALDYAASETALDLHSGSNISRFRKHRINTLELCSKYNKLNEHASSIQLLFLNKHKYDNLVNNHEISPTSAIYEVYKDSTQKSKEDAILESYFQSLKSWSINAYKEITSFRQLITGQTLSYAVMNGETQVFYLSEDEYLQLISNVTIYSGTEWKTVSNYDLNEILKLKIDNVSALKKFKDSTHNAYMGRSKDKLFNYLYKHPLRVFQTSKGTNRSVSVSRLFEIYTQLTYEFDWIYDENGSIDFLKKEREKEIDEFLYNYIHEHRLHQDTIPFYQMGDSVQSAVSLIENKKIGAVISIATIKNAIFSLRDILQNDLSVRDPVDLANRLKKLFIAKAGSDFERKIQKGAEYYAEEAIDNFIKSLNLTT